MMKNLWTFLIFIINIQSNDDDGDEIWMMKVVENEKFSKLLSTSQAKLPRSKVLNWVFQLHQHISRITRWHYDDMMKILKSKFTSFFLTK